MKSLSFHRSPGDNRADMKFIAVQTQDFDVAAEYAELRKDNRSDGAIVFFSGLVRVLMAFSVFVGFNDFTSC